MKFIKSMSARIFIAVMVCTTVVLWPQRIMAEEDIADDTVNVAGDIDDSTDADEAGDAVTSENADETEAAVNEDIIADDIGSDIVIPGVSVGNVDIGGLTKDEAIAKIQDYMTTFTDKKVTLMVDGNTAETTIGELGYYWKNTNVIEKADELCKKGNIIERYKEKKDVETKGVNYELEVDVNDDVMRQALDTYCAQYNMPHVNASLVKSGDGFTYTEESAGRIVDVDTTVNEFHQFLLKTWDGNDAELKVTMKDDFPTATIEDCKKVTDVLGSYSTKFTTGSSNYNRNCNIENGSNLLNGRVIYPGETFSANAVLEPWTYENGWREAGTYVNGQVENSLGGGICQVSSTLYNAVLLAELDVVERYPHSMSVGYVPLSQDAALAGTWKDLKFANNTDAPIYIESYCGSGSITFNIYGHETRDPNRTFEYVSETLGTISPSESVQEDPSLPAGYRSVISSGHVGYNARLWKKVYENGKLVSEEVVNKSSYAASPSKVVVGTGTAQPETPEGESQSGDNQNGDNQNGDNQNGDNQNGDNQNGDNQNGDNQNGDNQNGDNQNGDNQNGDNQNGDKKPEEESKKDDKKKDDKKNPDSDDKKQDNNNNEDNNG